MEEKRNGSYAVKTEGLSKQYGSVLCVDHVDVKVPAGSIYGFLGPKIAIVLLPPVVLLLAAVLLCWKTWRLAQTESRNEIYHGMWLLCAAVCVVLFIVETYPLLRELLF